ADLVRRYLEFHKYQVNHVMNITDVEDKIIKGVHASKTTLREFTSKFEAAFWEDLKTLNCREPHHKPHATEYIREIVALIEKLIARGIAYKAADGSVYFSIDKYRGCGCNYGQLLKLNFDEMRTGERVASDEYDKESVADFALWKARVPDDGDVRWPSPWGEGRPGWHIECSAMSMKVLGESFDLHLGGEDLKFPHHEDEIAQSEGGTGKPFVKYWMHGAFLLVEGKKMSKSLGNFFTLRDLLAKGFTGREIRYLLLTSHYRETFNFTIEGLQGARVALARIDECLGKLRDLAPKVDTNSPKHNNAMVQRFTEALDDDLNVSGAWGAIFEWIRDTNRKLANNSLSSSDAELALAAWNKINTVLGLEPPPLVMTESVGASIGLVSVDFVLIPDEVMSLMEQRQAARKAKDFKRSDEIRDEMKAKGWVVEDSPKGPKLKKI
ncbi:MAG TPA: cysteine--tRNA ligase, partial [Verrucomicrobiae bacterium]|nr:cysteine--tRNA ligase [Verrucomicrobiae bacterium]